jgi:hypothetical protein
MTEQEVKEELRKIGWKESSINQFLKAKPADVNLEEITPQDLRGGIWLWIKERMDKA